LEELVEYARKNPGKLKSSSGALWNSSHVDLEIFCASTNIKIVSIPFASSGEAVPNLLGGHLDLMSSTSSTLGPHIKAGKVRGLAYTTKIRDPNYPDIPTATELGYPCESYDGWFGVFVPAGVPQHVLNILIPALEKTFKNPEVVQRATKVGCTVKYRDPEEFRKYIESRKPIMEKIAQDANLIKK
jgi:tripartite-type tricarboxylate transporter receptor subunit TctC